VAGVEPTRRQISRLESPTTLALGPPEPRTDQHGNYFVIFTLLLGRKLLPFKPRWEAAASSGCGGRKVDDRQVSNARDP